MDGNWFEFVAIQGIQARSAFYVIMVPLKVVPKFFKFNDESLPITLRAQRSLNKSRVPQISRYMIENLNEYILSSLCASVDGEVKFEANTNSNQLGRLKISMSATVLINDGQHRRAAIEEAIREKPYLGDETISVVIYVDKGLKRSQQMFADLNMHSVRPSQSIKLLYNHRDEQTFITKEIIKKIKLFNDFTEFEKTSISNRSSKLFTFSSLHSANNEFLNFKSSSFSSKEKIDLAVKFWKQIISLMPDWQKVQNGKACSSELRSNFMHSHGIAIQALARAGNLSIIKYPEDWSMRLNNLSNIDWSRHNLKVWTGRALVTGKINKSHSNIVLVTNHILNTLGISLPPEYQQVEDNFLQSMSESQLYTQGVNI